MSEKAYDWDTWKSCPWDHRWHPCVLDVSRGCIRTRSKCCWLLGCPEPGSNKANLPICSHQLQAAKQQNCLLAFWSIYMHLQTGEGKGKVRERCQITGLWGFFFLCFPNISSLWLANKPGSPHGTRQHWEAAQHAAHKLQGLALNFLHRDRRGLSEALLYFHWLVPFTSCSPWPLGKSFPRVPEARNLK